MAIPYMPLYVADYLGDTLHLTLEQHGAYMKLLMCLWRSDGTLPNEPAKISRMLGITPARWVRISREVMAFFQSNDAYFWSPRLTLEIEKAEQNIAQKRGASAAGHEAKRQKTQDLAVSAGVPIISTSESDLFEETLPIDSSLSPREAAAAIWAEAPLPARKRSSKAAVITALVAAKNRRKNLAVIRQALQAYWVEKEEQNYRWARAVHRAIQDDFWESWAQDQGVEHLDTPEIQELYRSNCRKRMKYFLAGEAWDRASQGPSPDEPGCHIPPEIMAEFGFTPPARAQA